jgi:serpin B
MHDDVRMSRLSRVIATTLVGLALVATATGCSGAATARSQGSPEARASAAKATETFGIALMRRLPTGNLAFSPDSVAASLAMVGTGASGQTAAQMARVLGLPQASFDAVGELQHQIAADQSAPSKSKPRAPTLNIANGLFVQHDYPIKAPFTTGLTQSFAAVPQTVDFMSPAGAEAINAWSDQQTHGLIPRIVGELSKETRLALANAIYLKASWSERFEPNESRPGPFHGQTGTASAVFMHETESLRYGHGRGYAAVALPCANSTLSLLVVLPVGQSLAAFERGLGTAQLDRIAHGMSKRNVRLSLPRFHLHTQAVLNTVLEQLGMPLAFSEWADFSRMTGARDLKIGEVAHATDFKVNEEGVVAAATTVSTMELLMGRFYKDVVSFNANHPFLFFLRDDRTGAVLFAGRLVKPQD